MKREQEKPYEDGDYMEVVKRYEDMLRKNKQYFFDVDEFEDIIDYYLDSNKFNSASIAAEFACNQHPYSPEIQVKIAQIYLDKKLPEKALEVVDKVEYMETFNYEIYIIKGSAYNMLNRVKEAIQFFDRAIQLSRENIDDVLLNIGLSFEQYNHFDIAVHYLTKACKLNPANWVALFETAFCYDKIDDFTNSIKYYNLYLDEDTFSANAWFNLGLVQSKLEDFEKALESFDYALILDESYSSAYFNKANILANQGKYQEAIDVYNEYCLIEPDDPTALCYMGECYEKLKAYDKALDFYQRTIKIDEEFDEAWYGTGMIHFLNEEYTKSLLFIKKALKLDEDNTEYLFTLASIYTKLEEDEHALSVYKKLTKLDKEDSEAWLNYAEVYVHSANYTQAIKILTQALKTNPTASLIMYRLTAYYFSYRRYLSGYRYLEMALQQDSEGFEDLYSHYPNSKKMTKVQELIKKYTNPA